MVDGVGVCTICARVCHAGHDVTYSKHGSFFCDCGAKEDGSWCRFHESSISAEKNSGQFFYPLAKMSSVNRVTR
jgi:hypothetical protein